MLIFEIYCVPKPQKQTQFSRGRAYDPSKITKQSIIWQINPHAPKAPLKGPLEVHITFYMPIPKCTTKKIREQMLNGLVYPYKRPDLDNLAYIVTNAMNDIVYEDDSQIVDSHNKKRYGETPKIVVQINELG